MTEYNGSKNLQLISPHDNEVEDAFLVRPYEGFFEIIRQCLANEPEIADMQLYVPKRFILGNFKESEPFNLNFRSFFYITDKRDLQEYQERLNKRDLVQSWCIPISDSEISRIEELAQTHLETMNQLTTQLQPLKDRI